MRLFDALRKSEEKPKDFMQPNLLQKHVVDAFNLHAAAGIEAFKAVSAEEPRLSHVCLKFESLAAYAETVKSARELGTVTQQEFKGKQITWCRLQIPAEKNGLKLEWIELVEPKHETNPFNGVTSIAYAVEKLEETVKISAQDGMIYRYQNKHAEVLVME